MGDPVRGKMWAFVAVNRLDSSLDGLTGLLSRRRRHRLAKAVLRDVLRAVQESRVLDTVVLLSQDPDVRALGREEGIPPLEPEGEAGSTTQLVRERCLHEKGEAIVVLRGDLALLEAQDLAFLTGRLAGRPGLVLVPTPGRSSLSLVLARPVGELQGDFEGGDLPSWKQAALERGLSPEVYGIPAGVRPTEPQDLLLVYRAARPSHAKALMKDWDLGPRLRTLEGEGT